MLGIMVLSLRTGAAPSGAALTFLGVFVAEKAKSRWGVIAAVLGAIIALGPTINAMPDSPLAIIGGGIVSVAGVVYTVLAKLGYVKPRKKNAKS
jgi:hypothetical protein